MSNWLVTVNELLKTSHLCSSVVSCWFFFFFVILFVCTTLLFAYILMISLGKSCRDMCAIVSSQRRLNVKCTCNTPPFSGSSSCYGACVYAGIMGDNWVVAASWWGSCWFYATMHTCNIPLHSSFYILCFAEMCKYIFCSFTVYAGGFNESHGNLSLP